MIPNALGAFSGTTVWGRRLYRSTPGPLGRDPELQLAPALLVAIYRRSAVQVAIFVCGNCVLLIIYSCSARDGNFGAFTKA